MPKVGEKMDLKGERFGPKMAELLKLNGIPILKHNWALLA